MEQRSFSRQRVLEGRNVASTRGWCWSLHGCTCRMPVRSRRGNRHWIIPVLSPAATPCGSETGRGALHQGCVGFVIHSKG